MLKCTKSLSNRSQTPQALLACLRHALVYLLCFSIIWGGGMPIPQANASSYAEGNRRYMSGDFRGAEASLRQALPRTKVGVDRAKALKLLGICEYMQGKKQNAAATFKATLQQDPRAQISANEVLDESVIAFFNAQRRGTSSRAVAPIQQARSPIAGKAAKTTSLIVNANIASASINIDGIFAGKVGNRIEADPGKLQLEISAPGYIKKRVNTTVIANRENTINVTLDKIPPPAPKAVPKQPKAVANSRTQPARAGGIPLPDPGVDLYQDKQQGVDPSVAGRDLASEFAMDGSAAAYGMQGPQIPAQPQAPAAPMPQYQQPAPVYQQPPAPMYPAPMYAPPPMYAAPMYPPAPYYQQPYQAPPPVYAAPAPAGATNPPDYYGGGAPDIGGDPVAQSIRRQKTSKKSKAPSKKAADSSGSSTLVALLPFGAGQFQNKNYILGLGFAAAEGFAIYTYFSMTQKANQQLAVARQVAADETSYTTEEEIAEQQQYVTDSQAYVNKLNSQAQLALIAFGGLWAVGVIEAFMSMPSPKPKKKSTRPKRRRLGLQLQDRSLTAPAYLAAVPDDWTAAEAPLLNIDLVLDSTHPEVQPGAGLSLKLNF